MPAAARRAADRQLPRGCRLDRSRVGRGRQSEPAGGEEESRSSRAGPEVRHEAFRRRRCDPGRLPARAVSAVGTASSVAPSHAGRAMPTLSARRRTRRMRRRQASATAVHRRRISARYQRNQRKEGCGSVKAATPCGARPVRRSRPDAPGPPGSISGTTSERRRAASGTPIRSARLCRQCAAGPAARRHAGRAKKPAIDEEERQPEDVDRPVEQTTPTSLGTAALGRSGRRRVHGHGCSKHRQRRAAQSR